MDYYTRARAACKLRIWHSSLIRSSHHRRRSYELKTAGDFHAIDRRRRGGGLGGNFSTMSGGRMEQKDVLMVVVDAILLAGETDR